MRWTDKRVKELKAETVSSAFCLLQPSVFVGCEQRGSVLPLIHGSKWMPMHCLPVNMPVIMQTGNRLYKDNRIPSNLLILISSLSPKLCFLQDKKGSIGRSSMHEGILCSKVLGILVGKEQSCWYVLPKQLSKNVWSTSSTLKLSLRFEVLWVHKTPSMLIEVLQTPADFAWTCCSQRSTFLLKIYSCVVKGFRNFLLTFSTYESYV